MHFFRKIENGKWEAQYKAKAEEYDRKETQHSASSEAPLTTNALDTIALATKNSRNEPEEEQSRQSGLTQ